MKVPTFARYLLSLFQAIFLIAPLLQPLSANAVDVPESPSSTVFAFNLTRESVHANKGNVLVSPFGAYMALSMLANGANGSTRAELLRLLNCSSNSLADLNRRNKQLAVSMSADDSKLKLSVANAIFVDKDFPILTTFSQLLLDDYQAEVNNLAFNDPASVGIINGWVKEKTKGCIPTLLTKLRAGDCLVLLNAVYFKGTWEQPFAKNATANGAFQLEGGGSKDVPMMHRHGHMNYFAGEEFESLSLQYADNKQSLFILLPRASKSARELLSDLDQPMWQKIVDGMRSRAVNLTLPKFRFSFDQELNAVLEHLGMVNAFNPRAADFSFLSKQRIYVGRAIQKTFIDVNEEGTEAAAVTAITMVRAAVMAESPVDFKVNRPFVFVLRDNGSGELLFTGLVTEP